MSAYLLTPAPLTIVPSSAADAILPADFESQIATALTVQYRRACSGLAEVVYFGAMLIQARQEVLSNLGQNSEATRGPSAKGKGFDAWLEAHCPEISRQKAHRFRQVAEGVMAEFKIQTPEDVKRLLTAQAEAPKEAKLQQALFDFMSEKSVNGVLTQLKGGNRVPRSAGTYHPRQEDTRTPEERMAEMRETATTEAGEKLTMLDAWIDARNAEGSLTKPTRKQLADGLRALAAKVEK